MALFSFRTRSPLRDQETDRARFERLRQFLDELRTEMESERTGLQNRYEKVTADAAFSQQALEDDRGGADISSKVDDLTNSMIRYSKRIAMLENEIAFIGALRENVNEFARANHIESTETEPDGTLSG